MHIDITILILFTFGINFCVSKKYYNYTLFKALPMEDIHMEYLNNLTEIYDHFDFWTPPQIKYKPVDFIVSPAAKPVFLSEANSIGLFLTILMEDVQRAFDMQKVETYIKRKRESFGWNNYYRLNGIYQWLRDLSEAYPSEITLLSIGKSYEGTHIMAVRIILKESRRRSKVIIEGGIHAREWIAPAFVTYMINEIIHARSSKNYALREIALTYDWYFVPVLNPDGYEYSHTEDRLWRKNRNQDSGVDLNRNFNHAFGTAGTSTIKTSNTYCGPFALSEKESLAMATFVNTLSHNLEYYFAMHSYGQYMIIPYANSKNYADNYYDVMNMCIQASNKIATRYKTGYTVGTAYETVGYFASGMSACWVKKEFRVPYVLTIELRDRGYDGFALHPSKILPTCLETMDGIISLLTPRTKSFDKLRQADQDFLQSSEGILLLDKILIAFNIVSFIII